MTVKRIQQGRFYTRECHVIHHKVRPEHAGDKHHHIIRFTGQAAKKSTNLGWKASKNNAELVLS
jgi:hypothetical protein